MISYKCSLTQNDLKEKLRYNSNTGIFTWVTATGNRKAGKQAGCMLNTGYVIIQLYGVRYLAHRLAWLYITGKWPKDEIDHINHIRDDNRRVNLRGVTRSGNQRNALQRHDNASGCTGVDLRQKQLGSVYRGNKKYRARIFAGNKDVFLGHYSSFFEACCARKSAENKYEFHENHGNVKIEK